MDRRVLSVLVVDDSAVVRQAVTAVLSQDPGLVVTVAADPYIALDKMGRSRPDVILLDLEMPRMDGLTFLRKIMAEDPIPVVVCSSLAARGTEAAIRALEEGAVEVLAKPQLGIRDFVHDSADELIETIRAAAEARVRRRSPLVTPLPRHTADVVLAPRPPLIPAPRSHVDVVVAVGASTGGTEALRTLLEGMPDDAPPLLIVQHMPERFTAAFARRLNEHCRIEVKEAADGDHVCRSRALIAPGNRHMLLRRRDDHYVVELADGPPVCRHRPSVDVLFRSVAQTAASQAIGVIMTGMGDDGAAGLLEMRHAGAFTLAQDERTSVVFGMPGEAVRRGAALDVLPLIQLGPAIVRAAGMRSTRVSRPRAEPSTP
jgi:two-component system, chemotaxis family, protein-glutamate methylesterase/glutaminase